MKSHQLSLREAVVRDSCGQAVSDVEAGGNCER